MLLLSRGASPNVSTIPLQPIFYSVLVGEVEVAKKLLESGARTDECLPDEVYTCTDTVFYNSVKKIVQIMHVYLYYVLWI